MKGKLRIYTCDFALAELANVLRFIPGLLDEDVINAIKSVMTIEVHLISFNELIEDAVKIAFKLDLTIYMMHYRKDLKHH